MNNAWVIICGEMPLMYATYVDIIEIVLMEK